MNVRNLAITAAIVIVVFLLIKNRGKLGLVWLDKLLKSSFGIACQTDECKAQLEAKKDGGSGGSQGGTPGDEDDQGGREGGQGGGGNGGTVVVPPVRPATRPYPYLESGSLIIPPYEYPHYDYDSKEFTVLKAWTREGIFWPNDVTPVKVPYWKRLTEDPAPSWGKVPKSMQATVQFLTHGNILKIQGGSIPLADPAKPLYVRLRDKLTAVKGTAYPGFNDIFLNTYDYGSDSWRLRLIGDYISYKQQVLQTLIKTVDNPTGSSKNPINYGVAGDNPKAFCGPYHWAWRLSLLDYRFEIHQQAAGTNSVCYSIQDNELIRNLHIGIDQTFRDTWGLSFYDVYCTIRPLRDYLMRKLFVAYNLDIPKSYNYATL